MSALRRAADRAVTVLAVAAGAVLAFLGLQELFGLVLRALPEERSGKASVPTR